MIVTAWNNGAHSRNGTGYGFKVNVADRDEHFKKEWTSILLEIEGEDTPAEITIDAERFWGETPHELHSLEVGKWLRKNGLAPWPAGNPPTFALDPVSDNHFKLEKAISKHKKL